MANNGLSSRQRAAVIRKVRQAAYELADANQKFAQEMLLAKMQGREGRPITDEMAKQMATVATKSEVTIKEIELMIWRNALEREYDDVPEPTQSR